LTTASVNDSQGSDDTSQGKNGKAKAGLAAAMRLWRLLFRREGIDDMLCLDLVGFISKLRFWLFLPLEVHGFEVLR
jgi:hypothetical protein